MSLVNTSPNIVVASCNGDFSVFLGKELERRRKNNPQYSLRAFAKTLGLHNARLSRMLRDERPTSPEFISEIGERLGLEPETIEAFRSIAEARKSIQVIGKQANKTRKFIPLAQDVFEAIEDWRHFAILSLMKLKGFQSDVQWVAAALEIQPAEAQAYVDRLQRVGLLEIRTDGSWSGTNESMAPVDNVFQTSEALRRVQKRFLHLALEAIDAVPIESRDHSSILMATHSSRIAAAKKIISKFRHELCAFLEDCDEKDSVYTLSAALFPVARPMKGKIQ
jgi:uncharacterized protein (TIGR02147 family)